MRQLYEYPPVRSQRAKWVLEELGLDYESQIVDLHKGQQLEEPYLEIHPLGVVPALRTDSYTMFESVAIALQLIDENPDKKLAPKIGTPARAKYYQWSIFACSEVDPALMLFFDNSLKPIEARRPSGTPHDPNQAALGRTQFAARAEILSIALWDGGYLLGPEFSGADIMIGHCCFMASVMGLLAEYPVLKAYYQRLQQRPAFKRAYPD